MLILIFGQSGSGKSRYAEERLSELSGKPKIYAAMSQVNDEEMRERVRNHQAMRAGRGFLTVERTMNLSGAEIPEGSSVMVESLTAWTANVMFADGEGLKPSGHVVSEIFADFTTLLGRVRDVVVVVDDIFSDGGGYDALTEEYVKALAELTTKIAEVSDEVVEVIAGMPITYKKR
ncbi:MAG: bifunctional adenosylcobinamide kinase/adenosylcobinamide-phosphate guanylyltransferase [Synergistaceae bacterium]|nr:bifunctional adenosylcobinamide kinase/adenosylcobinamide-phosphate guanylyltransferase [Synergistaceae bacterium]